MFDTLLRLIKEDGSWNRNLSRLMRYLIHELGVAGLRIMLFLDDHAKTNTRAPNLEQLRRSLKMGYSSVYRFIPVLVKYGLVAEESRGVARFFLLTQKGKRLSSLLIAANRILSEK